MPLRASASNPALKAYLGVTLFTLTSLFLLGVSSLAYGLFYYNYVPQAVVERVIHLQFEYALGIVRCLFALGTDRMS